MTVPKNKSHTVYFSPLIKYYEGPIKNLPSGAPKDAIFTQFFNAAEFDTMINRILSDFRYMQKPRTFKESYDEKIIDNNMKLTLNNLFKPNSLFYINKKPYTIVGLKSNPSEWQVDKKPLEKLLNEFPQLTVKQAQDQAKLEEDEIPEILRQSNIASSNLSKEETLSTVASGLKQVYDKDKENIENIENIEKELTGITDSFVNQNKLPGVSKDMLNLYTKYLRQNIPINYSNTYDLSRDPITLSLLIEPETLLNFINSNKKTNLIDLYSAFSNSKSVLQEADKTYIETCIELAKYKTTFDVDINNIKKYIRNNNNSIKMTEQNYLIQQITQLKVNYMTIIFSMADAIIQIYELQHVYFVATKALLEGLKKDYVNIIQYYEIPELALKCIDSDISTLNLLINNDPENPYSNSYYMNYNNFKKFYQNQLYKNKQSLLDPQINYSDEVKIYIKNPGILSIEMEQYEIYNFKMFLFYSYNQFDIWMLLFKSIELFINFIGRETNSIIALSEVSTRNLNNSFTLIQQNNYLKLLNIEGVQASFDKQNKQFIWYLVKDDGTKAISSANDSKEKSFEKLYIEYIKTNVKSYDAIMLYIYLLEILCLRQNRVYVAEENVNQLNLEFSLTLEQYYNSIIDNMNNTTELRIPPSILWDINNLNNKDVIEQRKATNEKSNIIYRGRLKNIADSRENLVASCEEISQIINPNISKNGFIEKCTSIINDKFFATNPYSFQSSYWIDKTIKNYDIQGSSDFIYNMNKVVKDAWYDKIIDDIRAKFYLDWMVFNNDNTDIESLYAAVADGLNRQINISENETTNPYTELIEGTKMFTTKTIQQLVLDVNDKTTNLLDLTLIDNIIIILETALQIKFIIFEMFLRNDNQINIGDMVLYKKNLYRVVLINNSDSDSDKTYDLYNGYTKISGVNQKKIKQYSKNLLNNFRIRCNYDSDVKKNKYNDFMYIVATKNTNEETGNEFLKFKLVQQINTPFIFSSQEIAIYIKYLIFNSCPLLINNSQVIQNMGLTELETDLFMFESKRKENIKKETIQKDIVNIQNDIEKYRKQYKILKKKKDKSLEEKSEKTVLKEEIKDLEQRMKILKEFIKEAPLTGGAPIINPNEYYGSTISQNNQIVNPVTRGNVVYVPVQGLPYQNIYRRRLPYNVSQNKEKDQKSKLSFYITIELELFPGTSANVLQKSVIKCQSSFERIREAWADIFGFEYRPSPMSDVYSYTEKKQINNKTKTETENNKTKKKFYNTENNKTRKNKYYQ